MATRTISTKLAVEGESEYKNAISNINSSLSTLNTKLDLVKSAYQNNQNSMEALQKKAEALAEKHDALAKKVDTCKSAYENAKSSLSQYQSQTDSLKTALNNNETALSSLSKETQEAGQKWAEYDAKVKDAESKLATLQNTTGDTSKEEAALNKVIDESKTAMAKLEEETGGAAKTAGELYEENGRLNTELTKAEANEQAAAKACDQWESSTNKAQIQLNKCNAEIELNDKYMDEAAKSTDGCATSIDEFGKTVSTTDTSTGKLAQTMENFQGMMLAGMLKKAFSELKDAMMACVDAAAEFEAQMSTVEALSGATSDEMAQLTAVAKEMGATTAFTATEAGEALEYMALAGWSTNEMLDGLSGVMNLAAASGEDLATVSDIVTDAITAFGYSASDTDHFVDVLAATSANSNTTVSQLGEAFQAVGSTAGTLGYSVDDVSKALGLMADNGIKGSTAGTSLATALTRMSGANTKATTELDKLNVSMFDAQGEAKPLNEFLMELRDALNENYTNAGDMQVALYNLAGQKGMKGLAAIVNSTDEDIQSLSDSIEYCDGAAQDMADIKLDNYEGQVTLLKSAWDGLKTTIGEELTPALGNMAEGLTNIIGKLDNVLQNNPALIDAFSALAVGIGAMAIALGTATAAVKLFKAAMDTLEGGIGLAVTAIIGATAAIATFIVMTQDTSSEEAVLRKEIKETTAAIEEQKKAYEEETEANQNEAANVQQLVGELNELTSKTNLSTSEQERLKYIVDQLNEAIPDLALEYDEETNSINYTSDALEDLADKTAKSTQYDTDVANMNALWDEQQGVTAQLEEAKRQLAEAEENYQTELEYSTAGLGVYTAGVDDAQLKLATARENVDNLEGALADIDERYDEACAVVDAYGDMTEEAGGQIEQTAEITEESVVRYESAIDIIVTAMDGLDDAYAQCLEDAEASLFGQCDAWDEVALHSEHSVDDVIKGLESQIAAEQNFSENLDKLNQSNVEGMDWWLSVVSEDTDNFVEYVDLMANANEEDQKKMIELWQEEAGVHADVTDQYCEEMGLYEQVTADMVQSVVDSILELDQSDDAAMEGYNTLLGYKQGIDDGTIEVDESVKNLIDESLKTLENELGIDPVTHKSKKYQNMGEGSASGFAGGVDAQTAAASGAVHSMAGDTISAITGDLMMTSTSSQSKVFKEVGENAALGLKSGISGKAAEAVWAAKEMADDCINESKDTLGEHSPSTEFTTIGENAIQGYINGVNNKSGDATNTSSSVAQGSISAFGGEANSESLVSSGINTIAGYINGISGQSSDLNQKMINSANAALTGFKDSASTASLETTGKNVIVGFINGITAKDTDTRDRMQTIASNAIQRFKNYATETSLSVTGKNVIIGFMNGAVDKDSSARDKMQTIATNCTTRFKNYATSTSLYSTGQNVIQGFINGLNNKSSSLYTTMQNIAQTSLNKFNKTLGVSSPAKETIKSGEYTGEGYIIGLENMEADVTNAMTNLAAEATDAFNSELNYNSSNIDSIADAYAVSSAAPEDELENSIIIQLPIYLNGQYSREEIVDIAWTGISRKQSRAYAAKGVTA